MLNNSLVVVGLGIKLISHLTVETKAYIQKSDKVLFLVNEPLTEEWIRKTNPNSESLEPLYSKNRLRQHNYKEITDYIVTNLKEYKTLCVVMYGHPCIFSQPALDAVIAVRSKGGDARILPGISAMDCLFADLLIDPGRVGLQTYESTDFLVYNRPINLSSHLVLWQIGFIGNMKTPEFADNNMKGVVEVAKKLMLAYGSSHEVILYEASQYPNISPQIIKFPLKDLSRQKMSWIATLYVPPLEKAECNASVLRY